MTEVTHIRTEDGVEVGVGDRVFNYYEGKAGTIREFDKGEERVDTNHGRWMQGSSMPWFDLEHDDGTHQYLNGQRVASLEGARRQGYKNVPAE